MTQCGRHRQFAGGGIGKVSASFDVKCPYAFTSTAGRKGATRDNRIFAQEFFAGQMIGSRFPRCVGQRGRPPFTLRWRDQPFCGLHPPRQRLLCGPGQCRDTHESASPSDRSVAEGRPSRWKRSPPKKVS